MQPIEETSLSSDEERKCIACGYSLYGLGDEPRCPECGLLNVPEGLRRQVQQLVDSTPRFFSSFLGLLDKRLPGWWWSLDRNDDVRRSFKFAGMHVIVAFLLVVSAGIVADSILVESAMEYFVADARNPTAKQSIGKYAVLTGMAHSPHGFEDTVNWKRRLVPTMTRTTKESARVLFEPSISALRKSLLLGLWVVLVWAVPALIGICSQIRKGLPEFAKAPRTITAAANYEAHRLTYLAIFVAIAMALDAGLRVSLPPFGLTWPPRYEYATCVAVLTGIMLLIAAMGWIGPLRSDYTRQLIRSWFHGARIILMYAFFFPVAIAGAVAICTARF